MAQALLPAASTLMSTPAPAASAPALAAFPFLFSLNQGTLYPALLRLEQRDWIKSKWGASQANRGASFYEITRKGRRQVEQETQDWARTVSIMERFLKLAESE